MAPSSELSQSGLSYGIKNPTKAPRCLVACVVEPRAWFSLDGSSMAGLQTVGMEHTIQVIHWSAGNSALSCSAKSTASPFLFMAAV